MHRLHLFFFPAAKKSTDDDSDGDDEPLVKRAKPEGPSVIFFHL